MKMSSGKKSGAFDIEWMTGIVLAFIAVVADTLALVQGFQSSLAITVCIIITIALIGISLIAWQNSQLRFPIYVIAVATPLVMAAGWGLLRLSSGYIDWMTLTLITIGLAGIFVVCVYISTTRILVRSRRNSRIWKYSRLRRLTLIGLITIPMLAVVVVYWVHVISSEVIILVADFDGPDPKNYRVTDNILSELYAGTSKENGVEVIALGQSITEAEGINKARAEGRKYGADIVIWGWYGVTGEAVQLTTHFEILCPLQCEPVLEPDVAGQPQKVKLSMLNSFELQTHLSKKMTFLSLLTVGLARHTEEDWNKAIDAFNKALNYAGDPQSRETVYFYRANALSSLGNNEQAIEDLNQAILLLPNDTAALRNRGFLYLFKNEGAKAFDDFQEAIRLRQDEPQSYIGRAFVYLFFKQDSKKAIDDFNSAIKLKPDAQAYHMLGFINFVEGKNDEAIHELSEAINLDQYDADSYRLRGDVYADQGEIDLALNDINRAIEIDPKDEYSYNSRGRIYATTGEINRAIDEFDKATSLNDKYDEAYVNRGDAYRDKKDYNRAIADYSHALDIDKDNARAYYGRGFAYYLTGLRGKAIDDFKKVIEIDKESSLAARAEEQLAYLGVGK